MTDIKGYYVISNEESSAEFGEADQRLLLLLRESKLVNVKNTRAFNKMTGNQYAKPVESAVAHNRNSNIEKKEKRKEYYNRPEVNQRLKAYYKTPEVKERKRLARIRQRKLMSLIPKDILDKALKDEERDQYLQKKYSNTLDDKVEPVVHSPMDSIFDIPEEDQ